MDRRALPAALASVVILAGCLGAVPASDRDATSVDRSTVQFYLSDHENAIDDFEHLNITVTRIGLKRKSAPPTDHRHGEHMRHRGGHHHRDKWVVFDVDNRTVDLTELEGRNATLLGNFSVPAGTYKKTFVYVTEVEGVLKNGSEVDVRLPGNRLKIKKRFEVEANETVSFVFDVTVKKHDGEYVIEPQMGQSGTAVPFCTCDRCRCEQCDCGSGCKHQGTASTTATTTDGSSGCGCC